ncbi:MAG: DUF2484 family protein [Rhodobacterales bacterium]|nr:DUF2484 family protein [Rhodobacterales bacterium]
MSNLLISAIIWVFCAVAAAMMPMRWQFRVVPVLAMAAFVIMGMIATTYGWLAFGLAVAAFVSMFRHPLRYVWRRLRGESVALPEDISRERTR